MIGKILDITKDQIIDKNLFGDLVKVFFKIKEEPDLIYTGNLLVLSTTGRYTVLVTGDDKYNLDPEA